jgi:cobaltochelatase CobN
MHLLATKAITLDEADQAVDLGQTPAEVVVLSFSDSDLSAAAAAWQRKSAELPTLRLASLKRLKHPLSIDLYVESVAQNARAVIVRCLGGLDYWRYGFERLAGAAREKGFLLVALPGDDRPDGRLTALSTANSEAVALLDRYFREGGTDNVGSALGYVAHLLGRQAEWSEPRRMGAAVGVMASGEMASLGDLARLTSDLPVALVVFYRASLLAADTKPITALMDSLAREGLDPLAVAVTSLKDSAAVSEIQSLIAARRPAIILNATAFSALREDDTTVLDAADVPVLQVVMAGASREAWEASPRGLGPSDIAMNVVLPELDGRLLTRAISFKAEAAVDARVEYASARHEPAPNRIDYVARLAAAWVRLGQKARGERRLALMLSDYPQRGGRTGYAVGLDTPASVEQMLGLLAAQGYDIAGLSVSAADLGPLLAGEGPTVDVPLVLYRRWLAMLPESVQAQIKEAWGEPEADPAFADGRFRFPCLRAGKTIVLVQPNRGSATERKQGYHDTTTPPRHAYVALYAWLREAERIDAMIHLGTHGTLEWLPGKALALSAACFPEAVLGPVPVVYPFIVNNPGEAVQAKRRLGAVTIGHLTPPLGEAGLSGPLAELEGLIEEYAEADGVDRRRMALLEAEILERAWRSGLARDCGLAKSDAPRIAIGKLDAQLCDIKELLIRDRLHVFGRLPDASARADLAGAIIKAAPSDGAPSKRDVETLIALSAEEECAALLAALDGKRVAPGPSGAPTRGRADVLPTGRNLTTIDPRAIPTRTAAVIGARAADEVVKRYLQDHGDYPKALVLDLWASASLRTGGEDLAQGLAYLGVRPVWDPGSNRVTGVEVIPQPKLDRPRIDVTLRISGLFRDIFETQIALFEMAVGLVAGLDEDDAWNPLAAARRRGDGLHRIYGSAPGTYGAAAAEQMLDGNWTTRDDIGAAYLAATSHAFGRDEAPSSVGGGFRDRVAAADALVHPQDDRERDILDGDGVADFAGGFAAAAAMLGRDPALYHLDTSQVDAPRVRAFSEEIARIVRGRLTNPRWIAGMVSHGHRGVAEIAQGVDALYAFAASTNAVPSHLFDALHDALFNDEATCVAIKSANPSAADAIAARLEDAIVRGLWTPRRNAVRAELERWRQHDRDTQAPLEAAQ